jgi:hypothetical protein
LPGSEVVSTVGDPVVALTEAFGIPPPDDRNQVLEAVFSSVADPYCARVVEEPETVAAVPAVATDQEPAPELYRPMIVPVAKL